MVDGSKKRPHGRRKVKRPTRKAKGSIPPSKQHRRKRCGAIAKSTGKPCRRWAMANGRCMIHGGKSLKGERHPSFKTGLHSRYFADTLRAILDAEPSIEQDLVNADLQGVDDEIRLVMAMLMLHMRKRPANSRRITPDWIKQSVNLIDELTRQKERRYRMQKELRTITLEELQRIIRRYTILVYTAVENEIQDQSLREKLLARLQTIPERVATSVGT